MKPQTEEGCSKLCNFQKVLRFSNDLNMQLWSEETLLFLFSPSFPLLMHPTPLYRSLRFHAVLQSTVRNSTPFFTHFFLYSRQPQNMRLKSNSHLPVLLIIFLKFPSHSHQPLKILQRLISRPTPISPKKFYLNQFPFNPPYCQLFPLSLLALKICPSLPAQFPPVPQNSTENSLSSLHPSCKFPILLPPVFESCTKIKFSPLSSSLNFSALLTLASNNSI